MKKTILSIAGGSLFLIGVAAGFCYYQLTSSPFQIQETDYIYIDESDTAQSVRTKVQRVGQAKSMLGYDMMAWLKKYDKPRTGRYELKPGANMYDLVRQLANGIQIPMKLTVPATRTVESLVGKVAKQLMMDSLTLSKVVFDKNMQQELGYTTETLPGLFIPETYEVYWNISPENLVRRFQKEHEAFWTTERKAKAKEMGLTENQVHTLASIVESESNYSPEKPTIAGLYYNRIRKGMLLQSDPTVIYAHHDFTIRRVTLALLAIDSPYNTYKYAGLPPGPIRVASPEGLKAVLNYEPSNYIYMCAKEDFSGSHNFTSNLSEHNANARRYQQALNARGIKR